MSPSGVPGPDPSQPMNTSPAPAVETSAIAQALPVVRFDQAGRGTLRSLSFALAPGSFHWLTGGPGKSALLRLMALAEPPAQGVVQLFGRDLASLSRREAVAIRGRIGAVLAPLAFIDHWTVWQNAAIGPKVSGRSPDEFAREIDAVLRWLGLAKRAAAAPGDLTAAERFRLALARAAAGRPELLLIDAPPDGLEPVERERIVKAVHELNAAGAAVLMVADQAMLGGQANLRLHEGRAVLTEAASG